MKVRRGVRLALDWGTVRIGVAACDAAGVLAYPVATVAADEQEWAELIALISEYDPLEVLVGLPRRLAGDEGPAAAFVRDKAAELARLCPDTPVRLVDERLSTVTASRRLQAGGRTTRQQRHVIDAAAAAAILEHALDAERASGAPPGELVDPGDSPRPG